MPLPSRNTFLTTVKQFRTVVTADERTKSKVRPETVAATARCQLPGCSTCGGNGSRAGGGEGLPELRRETAEFEEGKGARICRSG